MDQQSTSKKLAEMEFINDQLYAEVYYLDKLLREVGFQDGLATLKQAAQELVACEAGEDYLSL